MAHLVVTIFGSTGDLNPFITLGLALRSRGHDVLFAVEANFQQQLTLFFAYPSDASVCLVTSL